MTCMVSHPACPVQEEQIDCRPMARLAVSTAGSRHAGRRGHQESRPGEMGRRGDRPRGQAGAQGRRQWAGHKTDWVDLMVMEELPLLARWLGSWATGLRGKRVTRVGVDA